MDNLFNWKAAYLDVCISPPDRNEIGLETFPWKAIDFK